MVFRTSFRAQVKSNDKHVENIENYFYKLSTNEGAFSIDLFALKVTRSALFICTVRLT